MAGSSSQKWAAKMKRRGLEDHDYEISQHIPEWSSISRDLASEDDIRLIRMCVGSPGSGELMAPIADIEGIWNDRDDGRATTRAFLKILRTREIPKLTYFLSLLARILSSNHAKCGPIFLDETGGVIEAFSRVWNREEVELYVRGKAALCAALILQRASPSASTGVAPRETSSESEEEEESPFQSSYVSLNAWILESLRVNKNDNLLLPLTALKGIIPNSAYQTIFVHENGITRLANLLDANSKHHQIVYLCLYALWALSFDRHGRWANHDALINGVLVSRVVKFVQARLSTKVTRIAVALCENLLGKGNFNEMVVLFGFYDTLKEIQAEKTDDMELKSSVDKCLDDLSHSMKALSSMDRFISELDADKLSWGPCHSDLFWKKYAYRMDDDNFKFIKKLIEFLDSADSETVAVACHDLGEWARYYPDGKAILNRLNAKLKLMALISHHDKAVRENALFAVQKVLIKNWQQINVKARKDGDERKNDM